MFDKCFALFKIKCYRKMNAYSYIDMPTMHSEYTNGHSQCSVMASVFVQLLVYSLCVSTRHDRRLIYAAGCLFL